MPWQPKDAAKKTKKANTPKKQEIWKGVANDLLGKGQSDSSAIRQASAVVGRIGKK